MRHKVTNDYGEHFEATGNSTRDGEPMVRISIDTGDDYGWLRLTLEQTERVVSALVNARTDAIAAAQEE